MFQVFKGNLLGNTFHVAHTHTPLTVCPTVEDGPKGKVAFRYPVSQFSRDCHEILQPLLSSHLATTLETSQNSIEYFKS